jgi:hypothetical protein
MTLTLTATAVQGRNHFKSVKEKHIQRNTGFNLSHSGESLMITVESASKDLKNHTCILFPALENAKSSI